MAAFSSSDTWKTQRASYARHQTYLAEAKAQHAERLKRMQDEDYVLAGIELFPTHPLWEQMLPLAKDLFGVPLEDVDYIALQPDPRDLPCFWCVRIECSDRGGVYETGVHEDRLLPYLETHEEKNQEAP